MYMRIEERLLELGVELPIPPKSVASYVPVVITNNLLVTSGQLPLKDGQLVTTGLLGRNVDVAEGQAAAKMVRCKCSGAGSRCT